MANNVVNSLKTQYCSDPEHLILRNTSFEDWGHIMKLYAPHALTGDDPRYEYNEEGVRRVLNLPNDEIQKRAFDLELGLDAQEQYAKLMFDTLEKVHALGGVILGYFLINEDPHNVANAIERLTQTIWNTIELIPGDKNKEQAERFILNLPNEIRDAQQGAPA